MHVKVYPNCPSVNMTLKLQSTCEDCLIIEALQKGGEKGGKYTLRPFLGVDDFDMSADPRLIFSIEFRSGLFPVGKVNNGMPFTMNHCPADLGPADLTHCGRESSLQSTSLDGYCICNLLVSEVGYLNARCQRVTT